MFLDPTPEWQRRVLIPRPMPSSDAERALEARLVKDRLYAEVAEVESLLEIPESTADLRAARRWENEVAAANVRAWLASPEAPREHSGFSFA